MSNPESSNIEEAKLLLASIRGTIQTAAARKRETLNLAMLILKGASNLQTSADKRRQSELSRMMDDQQGRAFTATFTDRCFRTKAPEKFMDQFCYLIDTYGVPRYSSIPNKLRLLILRVLGPMLPKFALKFTKNKLRRCTEHAVIHGESAAFFKYLQKRRLQGFHININHLGEAVLGEQEAQRRLSQYIYDLSQEMVECISVKISTLYSQVNTVSRIDTLEKLRERLRELYRVAMHHGYRHPDGKKTPKFVYLDIVEYGDLYLTKDVFMLVLDEPEFMSFSAGIELPAYFPDSFQILKELISWSQKRAGQGGAAIKVRIVKGVNLAMEDVNASMHGWPRSAYHSKIETDANFKKMLEYACAPEHVQAAHIGVGSHNLFDIAYALLLRSEHALENSIFFEMLEGMCDNVARVINKLTSAVTLYAPVATKSDFQYALAFLFRRLDAYTGPDHFLRHSCGMQAGSDEWDMQATMFSEACSDIETVSEKPRRTQNRYLPPEHLPSDMDFENEPYTDFALPQNMEWAAHIIEQWKGHKYEPIPLVIGGNAIHHEQPEGLGYDASHLHGPSYRFSMASSEEIHQALIFAKGHESDWGKNDQTLQRISCIFDVAKNMRNRRAELIAAMIYDGGKTLEEADKEVSRAIDFAEYYARRMKKLATIPDLEWSYKGIMLVISAWNFPVSNPANGIIAALVTGNCVLFKPARPTVLCGYRLAQCFWDAGISQSVLQFIPTKDEILDSLIGDDRVSTAILTGPIEVAQRFLSTRPNLDLYADTGGKNTMIITAFSDRDSAVQDLILSAFSHNGQKHSSVSLAICIKEVYDDPCFRRQLRDAAASLPAGSAWELENRITPLIHAPNKELLRSLTTLEPGEEWLLQPQQSMTNPNVWSPGIKFGIKKGSFTHQTALFGPVLSLMCADDLDHAIKLANGTRYGLAAGIHTLDEREQQKWQKSIVAGNLYINRPTVDSIVRRQPFGGTKQSSFGFGAKIGGSNYITQFMHVKPVGLPREKHPVSELVNNLTPVLEKFNLSAEEQGLWYASLSNYAFYWQQLGSKKDFTKIVGQDNFFIYVPRKRIGFRIQCNDRPIDYLRVFAAALTCGAILHVSWDKQVTDFPTQVNWEMLLPSFTFNDETDEAFIQRIQNREIRRLRLLTPVSQAIQQACSATTCAMTIAPALPNGRYELLHYLREISISHNYHRYGNIGIREGELRKPVL